MQQSPKYGQKERYVAKSTFIQTDIASDELLVESDYCCSYNLLERDLYYKLLAAKLALQKGYTHFKVLSLQECRGNPYIRPLYCIAHFKFYKERVPSNSVNAQTLLTLQAKSLYLLETSVLS